MRSKKLMYAGNDYGKLIMLIGVLMLCPLAVLFFYPEEIAYAPVFVVPAIISIVIGFLMCLISPSVLTGERAWMPNLSKGSTPVLFVWCYSFILGALPFVLAGILSPLLALFESVSGWTTTGLTVVDVESLPKIFLFHRSFMQYCGGLGFVIMISMVVQARNAARLYQAEGHQDKLRASLKGTSKELGKIYLVWLALGTVAYVILGMNPFEGICHTMSALSTAGFSTRAESIGAFGSTPIYILTIVLMIIGASNFVVVKKIMKLKIAEALRDSEFRFMLIVTLITTVLVTVNLIRNTSLSVFDAFVHSLFGIVTAFSTSGYGIDDYSQWPAFSLGIVMILMVIGGCAGSTAGGIKMNRAYLLLRNMLDYCKSQVSNPNKIIKNVYRKNEYDIIINSKTTHTVSGFVILYMMVLVLGVLIITLSENCSLGKAAFEFTSALGTVGLSCGITTPDASAVTLIVEMIAMVLGRLEILMVMVGIYKICSIDLKSFKLYNKAY